MTSIIETSEDAQPESLRPQRESRSHRVLRVLLIVLIVLSVVSGYATRPAINAEMRGVLRDSTVVEIVRDGATWNRPFLAWPGRELVARHRTPLGPGMDTIGVASYFSGFGIYLGSRSIIEPSPYARRQPAELERALLEAGETYSAPPPLPRDFSVAGVFAMLSEEFDLRAMESFEAFPAVLKTAGDGDIPVLVVHLWCESGYVAPDDEPEPKQRCGQAQRVVFRTDTNARIRLDHLL